MTQQQTVIEMLEQAGPEGVTSNQFYKACLPRFSARIHELRNKGFEIVKEPVENGHFRYILVSHGRSPREVDHPGPGRPVPSGAHLHQGQSRALGETLRDGPGHPPTGASIQAVPEPLFEVDEDGPGGPVNPYQWESVA